MDRWGSCQVVWQFFWRSVSHARHLHLWQIKKSCAATAGHVAKRAIACLCLQCLILLPELQILCQELIMRCYQSRKIYPAKTAKSKLLSPRKGIRNPSQTLTCLHPEWARSKKLSSLGLQTNERLSQLSHSELILFSLFFFEASNESTNHAGQVWIFHETRHGPEASRSAGGCSLPRRASKRRLPQQNWFLSILLVPSDESDENLAISWTWRRDFHAWPFPPGNDAYAEMCPGVMRWSFLKI